MIDAALILVDIQRDFCPGGSLAVAEGDSIIPVVNAISHRFRRVIATRDWHPDRHVSFASRHEGSEPFDMVEFDGIEQVLWPDHCVQGTAGATFHPQLDLRPIDLIVHKGTNQDLDSYSALFENDHTTPTGLEGYLRTLGISSLYLSGLATDVCVLFSAIDARKLGFEVTLITDATRGVDQPEGSVGDALKQMRDSGVKMCVSNELPGR